MPAATRRSERAKKLLKSFIHNNEERQRRALLRRRAARRARRDNPLPRHPFVIDIVRRPTARRKREADEQRAGIGLQKPSDAAFCREVAERGISPRPSGGRNGTARQREIELNCESEPKAFKENQWVTWEHAPPPEWSEKEISEQGYARLPEFETQGKQMRIMLNPSGDIKHVFCRDLQNERALGRRNERESAVPGSERRRWIPSKKLVNDHEVALMRERRRIDERTPR
ncbi:hypothetical protein B0H19DRAFT_1055343 [Mycena capillaripes]|nr:hypothetical protein B0H19DRAFT_1055343 [Mycena capillaripes]